MLDSRLQNRESRFPGSWILDFRPLRSPGSRSPGSWILESRRPRIQIPKPRGLQNLEPGSWRSRNWVPRLQTQVLQAPDPDFQGFQGSEGVGAGAGRGQPVTPVYVYIYIYIYILLWTCAHTRTELKWI